MLTYMHLKPQAPLDYRLNDLKSTDAVAQNLPRRKVSSPTESPWPPRLAAHLNTTLSHPEATRIRSKGATRTVKMAVTASRNQAGGWSGTISPNSSTEVSGGTGVSFAQMSRPACSGERTSARFASRWLIWGPTG